MKLLKSLKYFPLIALGKSVSKEFKAAEGENIPFYLHRRFIGAAIMLVAGFLGIHYGVKIDESLLTKLGDNLQTTITAGLALWGVVVEIIGIVRKGQNVQ